MVWSVAYGDYDSPLGTALHKGEGVAGRVLEAGQPIRLNSNQQLPSRAGQASSPISKRGVVAVPVVSGEEYLGRVARIG